MEEVREWLSRPLDRARCPDLRLTGRHARRDSWAAGCFAARCRAGPSSVTVHTDSPGSASSVSTPARPRRLLSERAERTRVGSDMWHVGRKRASGPRRIATPKTPMVACRFQDQARCGSPTKIRTYCRLLRWGVPQRRGLGGQAGDSGGSLVVSWQPQPQRQPQPHPTRPSRPSRPAPDSPIPSLVSLGTRSFASQPSLTAGSAGSARAPRSPERPPAEPGAPAGRPSTSGWHRPGPVELRGSRPGSPRVQVGPPPQGSRRPERHRRRWRHPRTSATRVAVHLVSSGRTCPSPPAVTVRGRRPSDSFDRCCDHPSPRGGTAGP
jgi:hypothetical protein